MNQVCACVSAFPSSASHASIKARERRTECPSVESIARGRKKTVAGWIEAKIKDAAINALEQEMRRLECELAMVRGGGGGVSGDALASAAAALDRARELVNEAKGH